jgi:hypothetical protein
MTIGELVFSREDRMDGEDVIYTSRTELGRITVLDRLTGFGYDIRDIETGYKDNDGKFWLASGGFDIRRFPNLPIEQAIKMIKEESNTCEGV